VEARKVRHIRDEAARPGRADHAATSTDIAAACESFAANPDAQDGTLVVAGMPAREKRYRSVFKNLRHNEQRTGLTQIWRSRVMVMGAPDTSEPSLSCR